MEILLTIFVLGFVGWALLKVVSDVRQRSRDIAHWKRALIDNLAPDKNEPSVCPNKGVSVEFFEAAIRLGKLLGNSGWNPTNNEQSFFEKHIKNPDLLEFLKQVNKELTTELDSDEVRKWILVVSWVVANNWTGAGYRFIFLRAGLSGLLGVHKSASDGILVFQGDRFSLFGLESVQSEDIECIQFKRSPLKLRLVSQDDSNLYSTLEGLRYEEGDSYSVELSMALDKTERSNGYVEKDASLVRRHANEVSAWITELATE
jgi:hypothetical protein